MDEYYHTAALLPDWLAGPLGQVPPEVAENVHEIRLWAGGIPHFVIGGRLTPLPGWAWDPASCLTRLQLEEVFLRLCGGSVHTHQPEIAQGYLRLPGGCRAGLGGRFFLHPVQGAVLQQLSSINLRIARTRQLPLPTELLELLGRRMTGILILGEPDSGKTTLLRSIARELTARRSIVCIIDERGELVQEEREKPLGTDAGIVFDRIAGIPKGNAVQMALRTLSPQVILLDELGGMDEVQALEQGLFSGVEFVATLHASSWDEALRRPQLCALRESGAIGAAVLLRGRTSPGQVREVRLL